MARPPLRHPVTTRLSATELALLDVFVGHLTTHLPEIDFRRGDALRVAAMRYLRE